MVSKPRLLWAAATIGVTPFGPAMFTRSHRFELCWRIAMVQASVVPAGGGWRRTKSFARLDGSEKSAVSYFLGQVQARLFAENLFGVDVFAHLDGLLTFLGRSRRKTRPDFVGLCGRTVAIGVEAKGRSNGWNAPLMAKAKSQAAALPGVLGVAARCQYAQASHFVDGLWQARLDDPPAVAGQADLRAQDLAAAYYLPLAFALREQLGEAFPPVSLRRQDIGLVEAYFPQLDLTVGLRADIAESLWRVDAKQVASEPELFLAVADGLARVLDRRSGASEEGWLKDVSDTEGTTDAATSYLGLDGVSVATVTTWNQWASEA